MLKIRRDLFWTLPNMVILVLISLIMCYLTNKVYETYLPIDNISDNYYDITIDKPELTEYNDLINAFDREFESYRLQKYAEKGYAPVYLKNASLNIDITEGREFSDNDFSDHSNVAIISDALLDGTYESDGKRFFSVDNRSFEVIGTFKKKNNSINRNSDVFISMLSENYCDQAGVNGRYYLDNVSAEEVSGIEGNMFRENETIFDMTLSKRLGLVKDTTVISFRIIWAIFIFFIFGLIFLFSLWISSKSELIHICHICGGERKRITARLCLHWLCISGIGSVFSVLITISLLYNIRYIAVLSAFLMAYYLLALIIIYITVKNTTRKEK